MGPGRAQRRGPTGNGTGEESRIPAELEAQKKRHRKGHSKEAPKSNASKGGKTNERETFGVPVPVEHYEPFPRVRKGRGIFPQKKEGRKKKRGLGTQGRGESRQPGKEKEGEKYGRQRPTRERPLLPRNRAKKQRGLQRGTTLIVLLGGCFGGQGLA